MLHQQEQTGFTNLFKFAGGQYRSSTGLYKFGERYYDPTLGRWTQLDSAGTGYTYANDNPVNEVDPSGQDLSVACFVGMIIGLVTGGLVGLILAIWFPPAWVPIIIGLLVGALIGCIVDVLNLDSLLQQWIISHRLQR